MRVLKVLSGIAGLCFWFSGFFTWIHFAGSRSKIAEPESGRVIPLNDHGSVVYLTTDENYLLNGLMIAGVVFILFSGILYLLERRKS